MRIAIAGGHGQIAMLLAASLTRDPDVGEVRGIIRSAEQSDDVRVAGAEPVVVDLESASVEALARALDGVDAVVFAAGAGPGSGAARKDTVDKGAAELLIAACEAAGVERYVMISAMGTDDPPQGEDVFAVYLRAKAAADRALMASDLRWTIVRPGRLTDDPGTGRVRLARHVPRGAVPRADVAAVLHSVLRHPEATVGRIVEVVGGDTPVAEAVAATGT